MKLKKPKFWDYKKPNFLSNFLFPISKFYELVLKFQPTKNIKKIDSIKTICVSVIVRGRRNNNEVGTIIGDLFF